MSVTVYGASDDLIEVEGDIEEEFNPDPESVDDFLAFDNGTVLRITYTNEAVWRITVTARGQYPVQIIPADVENEDNYSDRATIEGDVRWVVFGGRFVRAKRFQKARS